MLIIFTNTVEPPSYSTSAYPTQLIGMTNLRNSELFPPQTLKTMRNATLDAWILIAASSACNLQLGAIRVRQAWIATAADITTFDVIAVYIIFGTLFASRSMVWLAGFLLRSVLWYIWIEKDVKNLQCTNSKDKLLCINSFSYFVWN